jgi:hypothetical protein
MLVIDKMNQTGVASLLMLKSEYEVVIPAFKHSLIGILVPWFSP